MHAPPTQTVVIQAPPPSGPRVYENYKAGQARFLGWTQIAIGLLSIICWSLVIYFETLNNSYEYIAIFAWIGSGIWCGLFFLLPGSFGVVSANRKTMCPIVTFMVLSIVALVLFDLYYIGWSAAALGVAAGSRDYDCRDINDDDYWNTCKKNHGAIAMYAICVILSVLYLVVSIWSSVICCMAVCCGAPTHTPAAAGQQVMYVQGGNVQQGFVVQQQPYTQQQYPQQQYPQQQYPQQQYPQQQYPQQQYPQPGAAPSAPAYTQNAPPPAYAPQKM